MPHVISDRDFSKLIEAHAGKPTMEDVYTKLAEAKPTFKREWCPMPWKGCVCCGINTACKTEDIVYLLRFPYVRQDHEGLT